MRLLTYILMPMVVLLFDIALAVLLSFGLLRLCGDILPIEKLSGKLTQLLLVLGIFPLKKWLQLSWFEIGFAGRTVFSAQVLKGLLLSIITLLPMLLILYALDVQIWDDGRQWTVGTITEKVGLALLLALLIAVFEEVLFRGLLLSSLRQKCSTLVAVGVSSFYYAVLHFLKSKTVIPFSELSLGKTLGLIPEAFGNWLNPEIGGALLSLFVVGVFLATIRSLIPNSLGLCIGCHCGWVWQIKTTKDLCNINPTSDYKFLISDYDGVLGPLISFWLTLAIMVFIFYRSRHSKAR